MKHVYRKLFIGVAALMLMVSTASASGLSTLGVGARARSMGGAFRAIANDWSAAYWNPAGLAKLESNELDFTLLVINPRPTYTPLVTSDLMGTGFSMKGGGDRYPEDRLLPFPTFSGFIQLPSAGGLTFGAALYWTQDANSIWNLYQVPFGYELTNRDGNPMDVPEENYRLDLDVWDFHPTVAMELVEDKLSAGVGLSIQRGDLVFRRMHMFNKSWGEPFDVYPYNPFFGSMQFDGNGVGFGGNAGILYKFSDKLSFGITGQTPVTVKLDGVSNSFIYFPDNEGLQFYDTTYAAYYQGGFNSDRKPFEMDLKLPGSLGFGVSYTVDEQWTLAADVAVNFWSQMDEWKFEFGEGGMELNVKGVDAMTEFTMPMDWEDQIQLSLGAQCQARENLVLRGGYFFDQSAIPDETFKPYFPDYGSRHGLNAGASFLVEKFEFAGQINAGFSGTRTISEIATDDSGQFTNFPGEYKANQFEVLLSTIYRF